MNDVANVLPVAEFKDRRTGLMVFGILLIILGCLAALLVPFMLLGQWMAAHVPNAPPATPLRFLLPGMLIYLGLAVAFIWLGIGSILCRRWARALVLIMAWIWLISGLVGTVIMVFVMPQILAHPPGGAPALPAAMVIVMTLVMLAFASVIYVLVPAVLVFFYRSPHVKATCAARDPAPRWTDACPLPVLAISLMLGCYAAFMSLMILAYHSIMPCFGHYLTGLPGAVALLVTAAAYVWAARATYKLNIVGWWVAFLGFGLWMLSAVVTFARVGLLPMYELMGFPQAQLAVLKHIGFLQGPLLAVAIAACWLPFLGYVIYTRKYFKR